MDNFINKLINYKIRQNTVIILAYLLEFLTIFQMLFILVVFLTVINNHTIFYFVQVIKLTIITLGGLYIFRIFKNTLNTKQIAKILDIKNNDKSETLLNALELYKKRNVNSQILKKIVDNANLKILNTNLRADYKIISKRIFLFLIVLATTLFCLLQSPKRFFATVDYLKKFKPPEKEHKKFVEVMPGDKKLLINSNLTIYVVNPEINVPHYLFYKIEKYWRKEAMNNYKKVFNNLDFSFEYYVKTPYATSDTFKISVFELPTVKKIKIKYTYPAYTRIKSFVDSSGTGNISAIKNTQVNLYIQSNNPVKTAEIFFSHNKHITMQRIDKKSFTASFKVKKNGFYYIKLTDILNNQSTKINYSITAIKDEAPQIEFLYPAKDTLLTKDLKISLKIIASDDFGLQSPILNYQVNDKEIQHIPIKNFNSGKIATIDYLWNLKGLELYPKDIITYWCQISDNNPKKQTAYSSKYILKFPSIQEIYRQIEQKEKEKEETLKSTLQKAKKLQKEFELERKNLLREKKIDWEKKEKLKEILKKQKNMANTVKQIAKEYNELIKKMEKNKTVTKETLEKLKKIKELMDNINSEKLKEAMKKMKKLLQDAKLSDLKKTLDNMKVSMEDFNKKLEQTIKLLEQIKKEQALEKSLELAKEMQKQQKDINKKTKGNTENKDKLANKQQQIGQNLQDLQKQLKKTENMLDKNKDKKIKDALKKLQKQIAQDSLYKMIKKSSLELSKGKMNNAMQSQQKIMKSLNSVKSGLQKMLAMMKNSSGMQMSNAIKETILKLFVLYQDAKTVEGKNFNYSDFTKGIIANYESLDLTLRKLYSTPFIMLVLGPKFVSDVSEMMLAFQELFDEFSYNPKFLTSRKIAWKIQSIYAGYNKLIFDLIQTKKNMNRQGGMSSGMDAMMQALTKMGQQQMMMNMLTMQMLKQMMNNGGKMNNDLYQQAQRLAEEEGRLAENIKRMLQTNPQAQRQQNFLSKLAEELKDVSLRLKNNRINNDLIDKQKRILSRLLDAQKSIHKKDFSKKRKSEISEKNFIGLKKNNRQKINEMKLKSLLKESEADYPMEYRKLIDEYLKLLNELK